MPTLRKSDQISLSTSWGDSNDVLINYEGNKPVPTKIEGK